MRETLVKNSLLEKSLNLMTQAFKIAAEPIFKVYPLWIWQQPSALSSCFQLTRPAMTGGAGKSATTYIRSSAFWRFGIRLICQPIAYITWR